jgi:hypothetical protein
MDRTEEDWKALINEVNEQIKIQPENSIPANGVPSRIASHIDHTILTLDATSAQIDQLCEDAKKYSFAVRISIITSKRNPKLNSL